MTTPKIMVTIACLAVFFVAMTAIYIIMMEHLYTIAPHS